MVDLKHRVGMIERNTADTASSYAGQSVRIDRLEERLDRIERHLELSSRSRLPEGIPSGSGLIPHHLLQRVQRI